MAWGAWCDELVTLKDGTKEARCEMDVVIDQARAPMDWVKDLMAGHFAIPVLDGSKWGVFIDRARAVDKVYEFSGPTANQELDSLAVSVESRAKTPTEIEVTYIDRDEEYERETLLIVPDVRNDERTKRTVMLPGVARRSQAIRVGNHILRSTREMPALTEFIAMPDGALSEVGDVILVKSDVGDWEDGKLFRVLRVGFNQKLRVSLLCREYSTNVYGAASSELPVSKGTVINDKPTAQSAGKAARVTQPDGSTIRRGRIESASPKKQLVITRTPTLKVEEPDGGVA
ncbi:hypothetical protein DRQ32_08505 [bacterium]|nr:MAG: hypothetical protein DRQ32_08505 [bacterium]